VSKIEQRCLITHVLKYENVHT